MSSLPLANHNFSTPTNHIPGLSRTTFVFKDIQGPKFAVFKFKYCQGWLSSRVVSVLDSSAEGPRVQMAVATLSGNSLRQTVHTHCTSVHQTAKLVAAILRVARVTAGLAESNGSLPQGLTHITCMLTAKNRDQLRNHTLGNRVWATFTFFYCQGPRGTLLFL